MAVIMITWVASAATWYRGQCHVQQIRLRSTAYRHGRERCGHHGALHRVVRPRSAAGCYEHGQHRGHGKLIRRDVSQESQHFEPRSAYQRHYRRRHVRGGCQLLR
jgi:hypothetical protein